MDNVEAPPMASTSSSFFTPLCISLMGILFTSLVLLTYHLIARSYRRRQAIAASATAAALLRASPEAGSVKSGVDGKVLETIPIIPYSSEEKCGVFRLDQSECAVCLGELEEGEMVRVLPNCKHGFHVVCINQWFMGHSSCPVCRYPVVPLPTNCVDVERSIRVEVSPDHQNDHVHTSDEDCARNATRPCALLRHCVSLVLPMEKQQRSLLMGLKRSLSVDQTHVIIDVDRDCARDSLSSSSSLASRENLTRSKSITSHFDSVSLKLWKSCSRLSASRQSSTSGVLPY